MIVYFASRDWKINLVASSTTRDGAQIFEDLLSEDLETGTASFTGSILYNEKNYFDHNDPHRHPCDHNDRLWQQVHESIPGKPGDLRNIPGSERPGAGIFRVDIYLQKTGCPVRLLQLTL